MRDGWSSSLPDLGLSDNRLMATVATSLVPYCTAAEFLTYYDKRSIARLCSDVGTPVDPTALELDPVLNQQLLYASGKLEAKALRGKRYAIIDLQNLAGLTPGFVVGAGGAYLKAIVAGVAMWGLIRFRPTAKVPLPDTAKEAVDELEKLGNGEEIFSFAENADAGLMKFAPITNTQVAQRNDLVSQATPYFGNRSVDVPPI